MAAREELHGRTSPSHLESLVQIMLYQIHTVLADLPFYSYHITALPYKIY